jgi:hypothetical protein
MKTNRTNLIVALLSIACAVPALAFLTSTVTPAAPEREGIVTVGEIVQTSPVASPTVHAPETRVVAKRPVAKAPAAVDPRIAARMRQHDATLQVSTSPNARQATCAPNCRKRSVAFSFEAPGNLPL